MARNRDYSDFIKFVKDNQDLSQQKIITEYRKQGGKVQKQKALELIRETFQIEKGEKKGKSIQQKKRAEKEYIYSPKSTPKKQGSGRPKDTTPFILLDSNNRKQINTISRKADTVKKLEENIHKLYGHSPQNMYVQISVSIADDGYTQKNMFSVLYPLNTMRKKHGIKATGQKIIDNLNVYYGNLAKRYSTKITMVNNMISNLERLNKDLKRAKYLDEKGMISLFNHYGIEISDIHILQIVD